MSFQTLYTAVQNQIGDDNSTFLTQIKAWINETQGVILAGRAWKFLEKQATMSTVASTSRYPLKADLRKLITVTVSPDSGTTIYRPAPVSDPDYWEYLQSLQAGTSDLPQFWYQEGNDLLLWPTYATASHTIYLRYRKRVIEMSRADYTTGSITTATNGDETITGSGTSWTNRKPVGEQWFRMDQTTGDYRWYRVDSITDDTHFELEKKYEGTSIAAGSVDYDLVETPTIPEDYHNLCFYRPMALAYMRLENLDMANTYWKLYDGGYEAGLTNRPGGMLKNLISSEAGSLDAAFYPSQVAFGPESPDDLSRVRTSTFG